LKFWEEIKVLCCLVQKSLTAFFKGRLVRTPVFLFAGALSFDEKFDKMLCKPSFLSHSGDPKLSSEQNMHFLDWFVEKVGGLSIFELSGLELKKETTKFEIKIKNFKSTTLRPI
jgi:hypothetical protein